MTLLATLDPYLACPVCLVHLVPSDSCLTCPNCSSHYPVRDGVPCLLPGESQRDMADSLAHPAGARMAADYTRPRFARLRHALSLGPHLGGPILARVVALAGPGPVLDIGGGPHRTHPSFVTVNIAEFPNVDVIGDAHHLGFITASVAGAVCLAVLEHVKEPASVVAEMLRVIRPGGIVYVETPFIQPFHAFPDDFWRFSIHGLKHLMRDFEEIDSGVVVGPGAALTGVIDTYLTHAISSRTLKWAIKGALRVASVPVRALDPIVAKGKNSHMLASGCYFVGRKPTADSAPG